MMDLITPLVAAMILGIAIEGGSVLINKLLEEKTPPHVDKYEAYECGEIPVIEERSAYIIGFFPYVIAFFVAEVAGILLLLFSAAPSLSGVPSIVLLIIALLIGIGWMKRMGLMRWR